MGEREPPTYRPEQLAKALSIVESTLRRWATEVEPLLSDSARTRWTGHGHRAQRQYTEHDAAVFFRMRDLFTQKKARTYAEVRTLLLEEFGEPVGVPYEWPVREEPAAATPDVNDPA